MKGFKLNKDDLTTLRRAHKSEHYKRSAYKINAIIYFMQFLLIAYDGSDDKALERRMSSRQAHIDYCEKLKENGNMTFGIAGKCHF